MVSAVQFRCIGLRNTILARWLPEVYRTPVAVAIHTFLVVVLLLGLVGSRLLDRRSLADYGFHLNKGWWLDLGFGLALGTLLMLGIFGVELAKGFRLAPPRIHYTAHERDEETYVPCDVTSACTTDRILALTT